MISDYDLFVNKYISVPKDLGQLNCGAFVAGIVKGCLDGTGFPARCRCLDMQSSWMRTCNTCLQPTSGLVIQLCSVLQGHSPFCTRPWSSKAQDDNPHEVPRVCDPTEQVYALETRFADLQGVDAFELNACEALRMCALKLLRTLENFTCLLAGLPAKCLAGRGSESDLSMPNSMCS